MDNGSPIPRRKIINNGLFNFTDEVHVVRKSISNIERQREADGTPITRTPPSALKPRGVDLVLKDFENVNKSLAEENKRKEDEKAKNKIDPAEVVKSYLGL